MIEFFLPDDTTPLDDAPLAGLAAGAESEVLELHLWHSKGEPASQDLRDLLIVLYAEDPATGVWRRSGLPPLDELWARLRVVGHDAAADPSQAPYTTDWQTLGAYRAVALPSLHAGCARYLELKMRPPSTASAASWRWRLAVLHGEHAVATPVAEVERGILTGIGDARHHGLLRGGEVTVSEPADERVRLAAAQAVIAGRLVGVLGAELSFDLLDVDGEALEAGEAYWAAITLGAGGLGVVKGRRGADPEKPAPGIGEVLLERVRIGHQAGGAPVIEAADLAGDALYDRHRVVAGAGLEVVVHPGQAIGGGTRRTWSAPSTVPVAASATTFLWQLVDGRWEVTPADAPPEDTALGPLAEVTADAGAATAVRDLRPYAGRSRLLRLRGPAAGAVPFTLDEALVTDPVLELEEVWLRASDAGGGSAGWTVLDLEVGGSTIYPGQAVDDQRPRFAFDDTELRVLGGVHERSRLHAGDVVRAVVAELPTGGSPATLEVVALCRIP